MGRRLLILLLAVVPLGLAGCLGLNRIKVFQVFIVNDTTGPVVVRDCDSFCSSSPIALDLAPGRSTPINRTANQHKYFSVTTPSGRHVGCVDLYFKAPDPGASVPISQAVQCPGRSAVAGSKTIGLLILVGLVILGLVLVRRRRRGAREA